MTIWQAEFARAPLYMRASELGAALEKFGAMTALGSAKQDVSKVRIAARNGAVWLSSFDGAADISMRFEAAQNVAPVAACIPGRIAGKWLRKVGDSDIALRTRRIANDGEFLETIIATPGATVRLNSVSAARYEGFKVARGSAWPARHFEGKSFVLALKSVFPFSEKRKDHRDNLEGVWIDCSAGVVREWTASNGHWLARAVSTGAGRRLTGGGDDVFFIPNFACEQLLKIFAACGDPRAVVLAMETCEQSKGRILRFVSDNIVARFYLPDVLDRKPNVERVFGDVAFKSDCPLVAGNACGRIAKALQSMAARTDGRLPRITVDTVRDGIRFSREENAIVLPIAGRAIGASAAGLRGVFPADQLIAIFKALAKGKPKSLAFSFYEGGQLLRINPVDWSGVVVCNDIAVYGFPN